MKLGLWFEPEMISEDSELFRAHPNWVLGVDNRNLSLGRNQYVLDLSRKEVRDYIIEIVSERLTEGNISYVKWDMNRNMTEIPQKDTAHKYILGLYEILEEITKRFPHVLFESCASGGGRFDTGMLYYMPQTWASDNTDACERLKIQYGTSIVYPISSIGAHVSDVPNHQTARITSLDMRNKVAFFGSFGYELDITKFSEEMKVEVKKNIEFYKENRKLLQFGDFIRLHSPFEENRVSWMSVAQDKSEAIIGYYEILSETNPSYNKKIILKGLDEDILYSVNGEYEAYGDELMNVGIVFEQPDRYFSYESATRDFRGEIIRLTRVK
jgi:alpha-galactosidase